MRIKRLEIAGFKSFSDKTVLDFQQRVTGVVGPNGCGKSNIVDAIRWCLGEQSAKNLRGKGMDDVIFAGSEARKPLGMAEVSLVFSTEDGRAPTKYLGFSEIQLTRRLFRDGESEYLINKTPCRLLDIAELFMDTGVGTKAYSIIEQGKIGQILHARPEERRLLIEEAAGVTKFKNRKTIALRKIEGTKQNIARVQDVINELRRQSAYLQRQAKKAERFKAAREEARSLDMQLLFWDLQELQTTHNTIESRMKDVVGQLETSNITTTGAESELEYNRLQLIQHEQIISEAQDHLFQVRSNLAKNESQLLLRQQEIESLTARTERVQTEHESLQEQISLTDLAMTTAHHDMANLEQVITSSENSLVILRDQEQRDEELFVAQSRQFDETRVILLKAESEEKSLNDRFNRGTQEQQHLQEQDTQKEQRLISTQAQKEQQELVLKQASQEAQRLLAIHATLKEQEERLTHQKAALITNEPVLLKKVQDLRDHCSRASSRLQSLQDFERQFAGYSSGTRTLKTSYPAREGLGMLLADAITIDEAYEAALEAVIADRLQSILCSSLEDASDAIAFLHKEAAGKAHFVVAHHTSPTPHLIPQTENLASLTQVSGPFASVLGHWLADTHVVDTLTTGFQLHLQFPHATFVTRRGDLITPDGSISGGSLEDKQHSLIQTKREIRTLQNQHNRLAEELRLAEQELAELRIQLGETESSLKSNMQSIHQTDLQATAQQKDIEREQQLLQRIDEILRTLTQERALIATRFAALQQEQQTTALQLEAVQKQLAGAQSLLQQEAPVLEQRRAEREAAREHYTTNRIAVATKREQLDSLQRTHLEYAKQLEQLRQRLQQLQQEQTHLTVLFGETTQTCEGLRTEITALAEAVAQAEAALSIARQKHDEHIQVVQAAETRSKELRSHKETLLHEHTELLARQSTLTVQMEHLQRLAFERHRIELIHWDAPICDRAEHEEGVRQRQQALQRTIEDLGEVNLLAIEEYAELEQRQQFLEEQQGDLQTSLNDLQQAIQKINRTTRKRFLEAFTTVNQKFQEVFPRLFCGGHAELRLTDEQDLLETGIDIIVQPPGKKLANVMLLSGGEKALTAVALIFSIFLIKPTPFCLLDEVDAPLDDANIGRFNEMVREMSLQSQFILITHNKTTMAVADTLYGVTMEEPGSSRLVSVNLG